MTEDDFEVDQDTKKTYINNIKQNVLVVRSFL